MFYTYHMILLLLIIICTTHPENQFSAVTFRRRFNSYQLHSLGLMTPLGHDQPETLTQGYYLHIDSVASTRHLVAESS